MSEPDIEEEIQRQLDKHVEALEERLSREFTPDLARRTSAALEQSTVAIEEQLDGRISRLERHTATQLRELSRAQESAETTHRQLATLSSALENTFGLTLPEAPAAVRGPMWQLPEPESAKKYLAPADEAPPPARPIPRSKAACPNCNAHLLAPSRVEGTLEALLAFVLVKPVRCHRCLRRFLRFGGVD